MSAGPVTLTIDRLGAQGDGVATHDGKRVFAPLTLAGEIVTAEIDRDRARVIEITTPSADRVAHAARTMVNVAAVRCNTWPMRTIWSSSASRS